MCFCESSLTMKEGTFTTEGRLKAEVDVLLRVQPHYEGGHVHHLLPNSNVALLDQHAGVVDGLRKPRLENLGLKPALQEVLDLETQHIVKLHLSLVQDTNPHQSSEKSIALKEPPPILLLQGEELSSSGSDLGQAVLYPPDLALVAETVLPDQLQLLVKTGLLERPPGSRVVLRILHGNSAVHHLGGFLRYPEVSLVEVNQ